MNYHLQCLFTATTHLGSNLSLGLQTQLFLRGLSEPYGFDQLLMTKSDTQELNSGTWKKNDFEFAKTYIILKHT